LQFAMPLKGNSKAVCILLNGGNLGIAPNFLPQIITEIGENVHHVFRFIAHREQLAQGFLFAFYPVSFKKSDGVIHRPLC
jgi:hypothetical protein